MWSADWFPYLFIFFLSANKINCVLTPRQDDYSLVDATAEIKSLGRHLLKIYMGDNLVATTAFDRTRGMTLYWWILANYFDVYLSFWNSESISDIYFDSMFHFSLSVYLRSTLPLGMAQKVISLDLDETDV